MSSMTRATAFSSFMVIIATEIRWLIVLIDYSAVWGFSIGALGDQGLAVGGRVPERGEIGRNTILGTGAEERASGAGAARTTN